MYRITLVGLALGLLAAIIASACAPAAKSVSQVRFGQIGAANLDYLPIAIAQEKGFFRDEGIELDAIVSEGGAKAKDVFVAGETDIAVFGLDLASGLLLQGVDLRVVGIMTDGMAWALGATKDSGIKSVKDLKGKSVAISSPGSMTHGTAVYALKQNGLDPEKDVAMVAVGIGPPVLAALKAKKVDSAVLTEPHLSQAIEENLVNEIYDFSKELKGLGTTHLAVKKAYIDRNPEIIKGWLRAIDKGLTYIRSNKEEAFTIAQKQFPATPESVLRRAFERNLQVYPGKADFTKNTFEYERDVSLKIGFVKEFAKYEQMEYKR